MSRRLEKLAEADRQKTVLEAKAEAEAIRLKVISWIWSIIKGCTFVSNGTFSLTKQGEAEAFAIEAKAKAEAEQMNRKAMAYKDYNEAAMIDMLMKSLPKVLL